ncbi:MAG: hypothetical protein KDD44_01475 [Bdellovibrionales bacterium]|nr:hypothetical protein [Bdellovibrionales bacterium]
MLLQRVVEEFVKRRIRYAIAGGYAVALHGAVRATVDIDLLVPLEEKTLVAVEQLLNSLGLVSRLPVSAVEIATFRNEYVQKRNLKAWTFVNPSLPIEIVDILMLHDLREFKTTAMATGFGRIMVLAIDDLIRMKQEAGRPQDLADVAALMKLNRGE